MQAPPEASPPLAAFIADRIDERAVQITRDWVAILEERLRTSPERVLPTDSILNHIPVVLHEVANFIRDPGDDPLTKFVLEDLAALAQLRRRQGFSIEEILVEFEILSGLMQEEIEQAVADFPSTPDAVHLTRIVGRLKDAIYVLGTVTARRFRAWSTRQDRERTATLATFTAMLSHELGNRLGAAETAVRLLMEADLDISAERTQHIQALILKSLGGAMDAVRDVHAIADPHGDEIGWTGHRLPLNIMLREAVRQATLKGSRKGIGVRLATEPPDALVDAERVPLLLSNLLGNAIKHHDLVRKPAVVSVDVVEQGAFWQVSVADNGPGIPVEIHERIFEPNVQGSEDADGNGLGLAIAREAAEQMGGSIWLESAPGEGTTFNFTIPRNGSEPGQAEGGE